MGDTGSSDFQFSNFAPTTKSDASALDTNSLYVRLAIPGGGLDVQLAIYNTTSALFTTVQAPVHASNDLASASLVSIGDVYTKNHATLGYWHRRYY